MGFRLRNYLLKAVRVTIEIFELIDSCSLQRAGVTVCCAVRVVILFFIWKRTAKPAADYWAVKKGGRVHVFTRARLKSSVIDDVIVMLLIHAVCFFMC